VDAYSVPTSTIAYVQSLMGHQFEAFSDYEGWRSYSGWPGRTADLARAAHGLLYVNINTHETVHGRKVPVCWRDITAGRYDADIRGWASAIAAQGYQRWMVITIGHEPNVKSRQQPKCDGDSPSQYARMYDHVYRLMRSGGVTARFAFVPTISVYRIGQADAYLPPVDEIQVYGADLYNRVPRGDADYHRGSDDLATMLAWGDRRLPGRPVILGEIGDVCRDPAQDDWVRDVLNAVRAHGHFVAVNWNLTGAYNPLDGPARSVWLTMGP
jgi:hypothetical protein